MYNYKDSSRYKNLLSSAGILTLLFPTAFDSTDVTVSMPESQTGIVTSDPSCQLTRPLVL